MTEVFGSLRQLSQRELPKSVERSVNEEMQAQFVRHQVYLQQLGTSEAVKIQALLSDLEGDVAKQLTQRFDGIQARGFDRGVNTTRRMQSMFVSFRKLNDQAIKTIQDQTAETLTELAVDEQDFIADTLKNTLPVRYDTRLVSPQYLRTIATKPLIEGTPLNTWWGKLADDTQIRLESAVRLSSAEGETVEQAIRRIRGTTQGGAFVDGALTGTRREAEALARTALNGTANQARMEVLEENDDLLKGYQWVSTLDSRICLQCAGLDGKNYESMEGRIQPPAHVNCRCTLVPVLKSEEELGLPPVKGIKSTRASMNGQVPASQTYGRWLKDQPVSVQEDVLGKRKAKLFRDGKLKIGSFTNRKGKTLTLDELKVKEGRKAKRATKPKTIVDEIENENKVTSAKAKIVADKNAPIEKRIEAWEEGDILVAQAKAIWQKQQQKSVKLVERKTKLMEEMENADRATTLLRQKQYDIKRKLEDSVQVERKKIDEKYAKSLEGLDRDSPEYKKIREAKKGDIRSLSDKYTKDFKEANLEVDKELLDVDTKRNKLYELYEEVNKQLKSADQGFDLEAMREELAELLATGGDDWLAVGSRRGFDPRIEAIEHKKIDKVMAFINKVSDGKIDPNFQGKNPRTGDAFKVGKGKDEIDVIGNKASFSAKDRRDKRWRAHYDDKNNSAVLDGFNGDVEGVYAHEIAHHIEYVRKRQKNLTSFEFQKYRTKGKKYENMQKYANYKKPEYGNQDKYEEIAKMKQKLGLERLGENAQKARSAYFGKKYHDHYNDWRSWLSKLEDQEKRTMTNKRVISNADWELTDFRSSEVISMLTEDLYESGAGMAEVDEEAFKFIVGYLRGVW
jgi:SPP1 gp7 family putative phage head morphogenesis protein